MNVHYTLFNPNGNITILVDTSVHKNDYQKVASQLMKIEPSCEQVGFVTFDEEECDIKLEMAGGEFCGNATLCAAVLWCQHQHIDLLEQKVCFVDVQSGLIQVHVLSLIDNTYQALVEMPLPTSIQNRNMVFENRTYRLPLVRFKGISHFIVETGMDKITAEKCVRIWAKELHLDALGIMLLDQKSHILTPLVYVQKSDTLFWENSCASGTSAVGAYLAKIAGFQIGITLHEPGGTLRVEADQKKSLLLTGSAKIEKEQTVSLPE